MQSLLGEIELGEFLNEGAFGLVFRASVRRAPLGAARLAVKLPRPGFMHLAEGEALIRREAEVLSWLRHRAIVRGYGLVHVDGRLGFAMEYVPGCDLSALCARGPLPLRVALQIAAEVASALDYAWSCPGPDGAPLRVIHRDIKPANVRVSPSGRVRVLDFGVARAELAGNTEGWGTRAYMAPERLGKRGDAPPSDIYSLGAMLYEMLTGFHLGFGSADLVAHSSLLAQAARTMEALGVPARVRALVLVTLAFQATTRPGAASVAREARHLARAVGGSSRQDWARRAVRAEVERRRAPPSLVSAAPMLPPAHPGFTTWRSATLL